VEFAKVSANWQKPGGRDQRNQGELCHVFRRRHLSTQTDRAQIGYVASKPPSVEHLENILSSMRPEWEPALAADAATASRRDRQRR
jgi:hypothetical protein